jgi:hypothetical protein
VPHTALHAARVGSGAAAAGAFQVERGEQLGRPAAGGPARQVQQPGHHLQVLLAGQLVVDGRVLAGQADRAADAGRVGEQVVPGDHGVAAVRPDQGGEDADHRRLARAVRAQKREDGAGVDGKIDVIEREVAAEGLGDPRGVYCVWHTRTVCLIHS